MNVRNIIPQDCVFGGTMRAVKREVLEKMKAELEKEIKGICQVYELLMRQISRIHGGSVKNAPELLNGVKKSVADVLGKENVYIIEEDNLGGENFAEYSCRVPAVYMFIGIKPEEKRLRVCTVRNISLMIRYWQEQPLHLPILRFTAV